MRSLRFLSPFVFIPMVAAAVAWGGLWGFVLPVVVFGLIPVAELILPRDRVNFDDDEEEARLSDWRYDAVVWAWVPAQVGIVVGFMASVAGGGWSTLDLVGMTFTVGICCASFGINVGHELGHRRNRYEQLMAKILLVTTMYTHFFIEHNRGHHRRVSTPEDPASARRGEVVYAFWFRSVIGGWRSAWQLEANRLGRLNQSPWTLNNEMLRLQLLQLAAIAAAIAVFGPLATALWVVAGAMGFLLLETINYVEHYGLTRDKTDRGVYERVQPHHSWNAENPLGRVLLFELTRHSDHHAHATRKYQVLRHFEGVPELPTGYPGMILLSLVPPLWFRVMHPTLDQYQASRAAAA